MDHIEGNMFDPVEEATLVRPVVHVKLTDDFVRVLDHSRRLGPEPAAHGGHCHSAGLAEMVSGYKARRWSLQGRGLYIYKEAVSTIIESLSLAKT